MTGEVSREISKLTFMSQRTLTLEITLNSLHEFKLLKELLLHPNVIDLLYHFITASTYKLPHSGAVELLVLPRGMEWLSGYGFNPMFIKNSRGVVLLPANTSTLDDEELRVLSSASEFHFKYSLHTYHYMASILSAYPPHLLIKLGKLIGKGLEPRQLPPKELGALKVNLSWLTYKLTLSSLRYAAFKLGTEGASTDHLKELFRRTLRRIAGLTGNLEPAISVDTLREPRIQALEIVYPLRLALSSQLEVELMQFLDSELDKLLRGEGTITVEQEEAILKRLKNQITERLPKRPPAPPTPPKLREKPALTQGLPKAPTNNAPLRGNPPKFCPRCGARTVKGAIFCSNCGLDLRPYYE